MNKKIIESAKETFRLAQEHRFENVEKKWRERIQTMMMLDSDNIELNEDLMTEAKREYDVMMGIISNKSINLLND